jgi:hypothetical protein
MDPLVKPEDDRGLGEDDRGLGEDDRGLGEDDRGLGEDDRGLGEDDRGLGGDGSRTPSCSSPPSSSPPSSSGILLNSSGFPPSLRGARVELLGLLLARPEGLLVLSLGRGFSDVGCVEVP